MLQLVGYASIYYENVNDVFSKQGVIENAEHF